MTWYRLIKDGKLYLPDWDTLPVIAQTLCNHGATIDGIAITLQQIRQAYLLDKGKSRSTGYDTLKSGAAQADAIVGVIANLPPASQLQLMEDLAPFLPQQLQLKLLHTLAALVAGETVEKREGKRDDDDGPDLRP